jgi:hypothetical protein
VAILIKVAGAALACNSQSGCTQGECEEKLGSTHLDADAAPRKCERLELPILEIKCRRVFQQSRGDELAS